MEHPQTNQEEPGATSAPIAAPMLEPIQGQSPSFFPLNVRMGKGVQNLVAPGKGYHTPLTRPAVMQNPLVKGGGWVHPIQDPMRPVHQGRGWIQPSTHDLRPPMRKGAWFPPPPPPYPGVQYQHHQGYPGFERFMQYAASAAAEMPPGWVLGMTSKQIKTNRPKIQRMLPDKGREPSGVSEASPQRTPLLKGRGKGKSRKEKVWITIHGKIRPAYYRED